jgi:hypothetical protein
MRSLARAVVLAAAGLLAGAVATVLWYSRAPAFVLDLERDIPPNVSGLYAVERAGRVPFAWTTPRVAVALPDVDRRVAWRCAMKLRGARPPGVPRADLDVTADGVTLLHGSIANDAAEDIAVTVPVRPSTDGLTLVLTVSPPFQPGPTDRRQLGVEVTALSCVPESTPRAPTRALTAAAAATGILGGALGLMGLAVTWAVALLVAFGLASGLVVAWGAGPYSTFPSTAVALAASTGIALVLTIRGLELRRRPVSAAARFAVALSATLFAIEALALLHPSKATVDAVFHAHRLEWVLDGRFYFTQPMPSGVRFPYAIALYVVAAPWTIVASNHVALLKIVVLASRAIAGLLLYPVVTRAWQDRAAGVVAILLVHLVPLPFAVIGYANLTYAFGQSAAVMTMAAAAFVGLGATGWRGAVGLWALASLAFLSHVGLFPVVATLLLAAAAGYAVAGGRTLRRAAMVVTAATILAVIFSVVLYYGHFGDAYRTVRQVRAQMSEQRPAAGAAAPKGAAYTLAERVQGAAHLAEDSFGWPILALAAAGLMVSVRTGWRDPLSIVIAATLGAAAVFEASSVLAPVAPAFWRYAAEFISRVNYAALPALALLAARAVTAAWTAGSLARLAAGAATGLALVQGTAQWLNWLR